MTIMNSCIFEPQKLVFFQLRLPKLMSKKHTQKVARVVNFKYYPNVPNKTIKLSLHYILLKSLNCLMPLILKC